MELQLYLLVKQSYSLYLKKIMDNENILLLNNEIDMDDTIDDIDDLDRSSHSILSSFEEE